MLSMWRVSGLLDEETVDMVVCRGLRRSAEPEEEDSNRAVLEAESIILQRRKKRRDCPE